MVLPTSPNADHFFTRQSAARLFFFWMLRHRLGELNDRFWERVRALSALPLAARSFERRVSGYHQ